jgi:hypothetical protein
LRLFINHTINLINQFRLRISHERKKWQAKIMLSNITKLSYNINNKIMLILQPKSINSISNNRTYCFNINILNIIKPIWFCSIWIKIRQEIFRNKCLYQLLWRKFTKLELLHYTLLFSIHEFAAITIFELVEPISSDSLQHLDRA